MIVSIENILLIGSILLFISILAGKTSYRFGVPTLLFFLFVGMLAGSEGIGGIQFADPRLAHFIGVVGLNFILFSGGLDTKWESIKPVLWRGVALSTVGVLLTASLVGIFVWKFVGFSLLEGLLLGAIVSSTDAAAVFSILRPNSVGLKRRLRPTLELESGSNDPMAYLLTVGLTSLLVSQSSNWQAVVPTFFTQLFLGAFMGYSIGWVGKLVINRIKLDFEGLYPVLMLSIMFFAFSATNFIGGNGFLAVYLSAVYFGNQPIIHKKSCMKFFDGIAWLMQIVLFLTLGLLVFPSQMGPFIGIGILISLFLIFVARPASVLVSLMFFKMKFRDRVFISWVGLRGAVPIVFALYPLLAGLPRANDIFNLVFFITVLSVVLQGTSISRVARWLGVDLPGKVRRRTSLDIELSDGVQSEFTEIDLPEDASVVGRPLVELGFPKTASIVMVKRDGKYRIPNGLTVLESLDTLVVLAENPSSMDAVYRCLGVEEPQG